MFPVPNYVWTCKRCGKEHLIHRDETMPNLASMSIPKCPECDEEMRGGPLVHREPRLENPFKKY